MSERRSLLQISRDAGDASLGQTLVRLARLAMQRHQHEAASTLTARDRAAGAQARSQRSTSPAGTAATRPMPTEVDTPGTSVTPGTEAKR